MSHDRRAFLAVFLFSLGAAIGANAEPQKSPTHCSAHRVRVMDQHIEGAGQWMGIETFYQGYIAPEMATLPFITVEVDNVPCASNGCCNMLFTFRPNTTDYAVFCGVFSSHSFKPLYQQLEALRPKYILDGGANVGYVSSMLALVFPETQVIAVEPNPGNFETLRMNTARFPNVHAVNAGLWDKQAYITVLAKEDEWGYMFKEAEDATSDAVNGTTITALMKHFHIPRFDFVKLDIEGAEARVFAPTADKSWLLSTRLLAMELHDRMAHYYGLEKVSTDVMAAMGELAFTRFKSGEHTFWQHHSLLQGGRAARGRQH